MLIHNFNMDLIKYDTKAGSTEFLESMYSYILPLTSQPQHGLQHTQKTLIDNIFSNNIEDGLM